MGRWEGGGRGSGWRGWVEMSGGSGKIKGEV